jgi:hypothetical protein
LAYWKKSVQGTCFLVDVANLNASRGGTLSEHGGTAEQQKKREFLKTHFYLFKMEISVERGRAQSSFIRKAYMSSEMSAAHG